MLLTKDDPEVRKIFDQSKTWTVICIMHSKPISWCRRDALPLEMQSAHFGLFHSERDLGRILVASPGRICLAGKSLQSAAECFGGRRQEGVQSKRHNPLLLSYGRRSACI